MGELKIPQGYKLTEVGVIPEDWRESPYAENFNIISGVGFNKSEYVQSGLKLVRIDNVSYGVITWDSITYLPKSYKSRYEKIVLLEKDILLALNRPITNGKLKIAILSKNDLPSILYQRVGKIVFLNEFIHREYAYYILSKFIKKFVEDTAVGSDQPFISTTNLKKCLLPIPSDIKEQVAIANALSDVDALISSLEKLINKKQAIKIATMQQLLTGKTRLPQFAKFPDGKIKGTKQSELGEVPEDWEVKALASICSMKSGVGITSEGINDSGKYPCYGGNGLRGYTQNFTHDGDFALIGRQGALCGNVVSAKGQFFASEHAIVVTPHQKTNIDWLAYILYRMNLNQYSESSAQPGLSVSKLLVFKTLCPSLEEQTAIATILSDMDTEIQTLEQRLNKTRQIKQGMMQELLTGKTRLI